MVAILSCASLSQAISPSPTKLAQILHQSHPSDRRTPQPSSGRYFVFAIPKAKMSDRFSHSFSQIKHS